MTTAAITPSHAPLIDALDASMTLNPFDPTWHEAMITILSKRGTRDALIVRAARADMIPLVAATTLFLQTEDTEVIANAACIVAIAQWQKNDPQARETVWPFLPGHKMANLLDRLLQAGIPADEWLSRMASLDEATCLAFTN